ncbi:MAG: C4-dicarboxylate ABC transporter permease [Rhodospirillaceae bacterium]|nr:C4-dicarboxylate ABC transporter permease [Rhodospirillaceae bacterium]|tara:strand:- start:9767 stop:11080 length:1314 start_codon:yes stop_codon:yes gene_type:complete
MEWYEAGGLLLGCVVAGMALGFPVAFTFMITNVIGIFIFSGGWPVLPQIADNATNLITSFTLSPIPMFILMGSMFFHTGLAIRVFDALDKLLGKIPGRLCYLTVIGGSLFSTLTGSTMANTAMLGSLLVPEMTRRGYNKKMSMGPILGTGGLAMIIPPSSLGVLLASIAQVDVGRLLIAGLLPGLLLAVLYAAMITFLLWKNPESAPSYEVEPTTWKEKVYQICVNILPMGLVVFMVIGFIVLGWATPSESASFGVVGVVILAVARRVFTWDAFKTSLQGTIRVAGMVFFILMNSTVFSQLLSMSGASRGLVSWATGFDVPPLLILTCMFLVLILLGMFMDQVSMMLITVPIFYPLATSLGYDPIWFSLIVLMSLEMSATTPPFGLLLFIMLGMVRGTTLFEVAMAAMPYLFCDLVLIIILVIAPGVALYLPSLMGT